MTVPAGSVLIMHPDMFHRVSRSGHDGLTNHDVPVRFMMGGGFSRGHEPTSSLDVSRSCSTPCHKWLSASCCAQLVSASFGCQTPGDDPLRVFACVQENHEDFHQDHSSDEFVVDPVARALGGIGSLLARPPSSMPIKLGSAE